jgi:hypothetical protein
MNRLTVSIPMWQREALDNLCQSTGLSLSEILRDLINEHFKGKHPQARRSLTETPDEELNEYDRAVKAWCDNELKKMAKWYLDDLTNQGK